MLFSSFTAFQDLSSRKSVKEREYRSWRGISYLPSACGLNALRLNTCMYFVQRYKPVTTVRRGARSVSVDSAYWIPHWRRNLSLYQVAIHYIHKALANTSNIAALQQLAAWLPESVGFQLRYHSTWKWICSCVAHISCTQFWFCTLSQQTVDRHTNTTTKTWVSRLRVTPLVSPGKRVNTK